MEIDGVKRVAVIGAGLMGHGIAQVLALAGFDVRLLDVSDEQVRKGLAGVAANLRLFVARGLVDGDTASLALGRITGTTELAEAAGTADFVVEAVYEDLGLKQSVLARLAEVCPERAIMASSTSGLSVNRLAEASPRPERVIVTHFWNPAHIIPVVEVVPGRQTANDTLETTCAVLRHCGKRPVVLNQDVPGQIGNRLQFALLREALSLVQRGVASAEDVDAVVELTFGRRLPVTGPIKTADLGGLHIFLQIAEYLFPDLESTDAPLKLLQEAVQRGDLGAKTGRGFYAWPGEQAAQLRAARDEELIRWLEKPGS